MLEKKYFRRIFPYALESTLNILNVFGNPSSRKSHWSNVDIAKMNQAPDSHRTVVISSFVRLILVLTCGTYLSDCAREP